MAFKLTFLEISFNTKAQLFGGNVCFSIKNKHNEGMPGKRPSDNNYKFTLWVFGDGYNIC